MRWRDAIVRGIIGGIAASNRGPLGGIEALMDDAAEKKRQRGPRAQQQPVSQTLAEAFRAKEGDRIGKIHDAEGGRNGGVTREGGYGTIGTSTPVYYETGNKEDPTRVDIFPDGLPRDRHQQMPHGHIWHGRGGQGGRPSPGPRA